MNRITEGTELLVKGRSGIGRSSRHSKTDWYYDADWVKVMEIMQVDRWNWLTGRMLWFRIPACKL